MNKEVLARLRSSTAGAPGSHAGPQASAAVAGGASAAPKAHHHFRLRPASEAPSQRQPGGGAGRPAVQQQVQATGAAAAPAGTARGAAPVQRPGASAAGGRSPGAASGSSAARLGRPQATDIDSMFLPRKPSLQRPAGLAVRCSLRLGAGGAALP